MYEDFLFDLKRFLINDFPILSADIDCGKLPTLEHGNINLSESRTSFNVHATYTCHENYTLIGNENRTCLKDGWSGTQPQCLVDWCPEPPQISGGFVQLSGKRAGSTVVYECKPGHVLIGEPVSPIYIFSIALALSFTKFEILL